MRLRELGSGTDPVSDSPRNFRSERLSSHRYAIPRCESIPSKYPTNSIRKCTPGAIPGGIKRCGQSFDKLIKPGLAQQPVEPFIKHMPRAPGHISRTDHNSCC